MKAFTGRLTISLSNRVNRNKVKLVNPASMEVHISRKRIKFKLNCNIILATNITPNL